MTWPSTILLELQLDLLLQSELLSQPKAIASLALAASTTMSKQLAGKKVVDAVYRKGGRIHLQAYHAGRGAHPD